MFERKNQGVLAPHFSALVTHDGVVQDGEDDDGFLTLKERDHTLEAVGLDGPAEGDDQQASGSTPALTSAEMLSKRKLKMGESRKAMLKLKSSGHKVVFDEDGGAHEMYEMEGEDDFAKRGDAETQREEYLKVNREVMKEADVEDRRVAREKRQEKKRKRKDREREEVSRVALSPNFENAHLVRPTSQRLAEQEGSDDGEGDFGVTLGRASDASQSVSSEDEDDDEVAPARPTKKARFGAAEIKSAAGDDDEEALALRLLQGSA